MKFAWLGSRLDGDFVVLYVIVESGASCASDTMLEAKNLLKAGGLMTGCVSGTAGIPGYIFEPLSASTTELPGCLPDACRTIPGGACSEHRVLSEKQSILN